MGCGKLRVRKPFDYMLKVYYIKLQFVGFPKKKLLNLPRTLKMHVFPFLHSSYQRTTQ